MTHKDTSEQQEQAITPSKTFELNNKNIRNSNTKFNSANFYYLIGITALVFALIFVIFYLPKNISKPELETDSKVFMEKELNKAIDDLLNSGMEFTTELNRELYDTYITSLPSGKLVGVQGETEQIVLGLLAEIKGMYNGTQSFSSTLKTAGLPGGFEHLPNLSEPGFYIVCKVPLVTQLWERNRIHLVVNSNWR